MKEPREGHHTKPKSKNINAMMSNPAAVNRQVSHTKQNPHLRDEAPTSQATVRKNKLKPSSWQPNGSRGVMN